MPTVGSRKVRQPGRGYENDPMHAYASQFMDTVKGIVKESSCDFFADPARTFINEDAKETMRGFFLENAIDASYYEKTKDHEGLQEQLDDLSELYENDMEAVHEYAAMGDFNPVIGLTFPIHKFILMNSMFDKCIPHAVAVSPKFTLSIETRYLVTPEGEEVDMFREQWRMRSVMKGINPFVDVDITLPEYETTDVLGKISEATSIPVVGENLSVETCISAVQAKIYLKAGEINPETGVAADADGEVTCWVPHQATFTPGYGENDRILISRVSIPSRDAVSGNPKMLTDVISGTMKKNRFTFNAASGVVTGIRLHAKIDPSRATLSTASVTWRVRTDFYEIPNSTPINVMISPEEMKDINALYQVNQLTKVMSLINTVLGNNKDDDIKEHLDDSFRTLPKTGMDAAAFSGTFDFAPREGYYGDHITWRRDTFMDALDSFVTKMIQVYNDPNVGIVVVGRPDLIRKITPTEYTYQSSASLGPVDLDFVKTVVTSDKRMYTFMSSDKMRNNNNFIVFLTPRNSDRIMYKLFDYQAYVTNEIRNAANPALPAVHAFERYLFLSYQPVQSRIRILNPTGLKTYVDNRDPINPENGGGVGPYSTNDFTADLPESVLNPTTP